MSAPVPVVSCQQGKARKRASQEGSLSGDGLVLGEGDILAHAAEGADRVVELLGGVDALAHGERVGIVEELHLVLSSLSFVDSAHSGILLVQPRSLHISLLLRVLILGVDFTNKVRELLDSLLIGGADVATCKVSTSCLKGSLSLGSALRDDLTEVVSGLSAEVTGIMVSSVSGNDGTEARCSSLHWSVNERQLSNVVLVNHAKNGLLLSNVRLRVLNFLGVRGLELSLLSMKRANVSLD